MNTQGIFECRLPTSSAAIALGVSLPEAWQTLRYRHRVNRHRLTISPGSGLLAVFITFDCD